MPIRYISDYDSTISAQLASDNAQNLAASYAASYASSPEIAAYLSANKSRYPWLTPGASLSLAKAGQGPESPLTQQVAQSVAERRASKQSITGVGVWSQAGDFVGNAFGKVGSAFGWLTRTTRTDKALKATTRGLSAALWTPIEGLDSVVRDIAHDVSTHGIAGLITDKGLDNDFAGQSALYRAIFRGEDLGSGYFAGGTAKQRAIETQRDTFSVNGHSATIGRLAAGGVNRLGRTLGINVIEPGSRAYSLLSGTVDFAKIWWADPANIALKSAAAERVASRLIDPRLGPTRVPAEREAIQHALSRAPLTVFDEEAGLIRSSTRWSTDDNLAYAWGSSGIGARVMEDWANTNDIWTLIKNYKLDVPTARMLADTRTSTEALDVFQDQFLSHVLQTKPHIPSRLGINVRESTSSIRMFNSFPRESTALLSDPNQQVRMLVAHGRNARLGENVISHHVDKVARASTPEEVLGAFSDMMADITQRVAGQVDHTGTILGTNKKLAIGDKVFAHNHVSRGQVVAFGEREVRVAKEPGSFPLSGTPTPREPFPTTPEEIASLPRGTDEYATEPFARVRFHENGVETFEEIGYTDLYKHLPISKAYTMTNIDWIDMRAPFVDEVASGLDRNVIINGGKVEDIPAANEYAEFMTGAITMPNIREIKRATSEFGRLFNSHPQLARGIDLLDAFRNVWTSVTLLRAGAVIRSIADDTFHAAAEGLTSAAHPIRHIVLGTGTRGDVDGFLANSEQFQQILAHSGRGNLDQGVLHHSRIVRVTDPEFGSSLADNLVTQSRAPLNQRLAGNWDGITLTRTGNNLTDSQRWYWDTEIPRLKSLIDKSQWPAHFSSRALSNRHVATINSHLQALTKSDAGLLEMVGKGTINGQPAIHISTQDHVAITNEARLYINSRIGQPGMPTQVTAARELSPLTRKRYDLSTTRAFNFLWGQPASYFVHNPSLKDAWLQSMESAIPLMTKEAQVEAIEFVGKALTESATHAPTRILQSKVARPILDRFAHKTTLGSGSLTFKEADLASKAHATNRAREIFYDLHNRSQFADAFRFVFPFFDAWKYMITSWPKTALHNPYVLSRFNMAIQGARGNDTDPESGFFHIDPSTGEEVFSFPAIPFVTSSTLRAATQMQGSVPGLNMFSSTPLMPGVGPIIQIPLGRILPDRPDTDWVRKMVIPYGTPTLGSSLTPPFFDKLITAFNHDEHKDRNFANSLKSAASYLMSTGEYNASDPNSMRLLEDKARALAQSVFYFRGLFQWLSPTAPSPSWRAYDPSGRLLSQQKISKDYNEMIDELGSDNATALFLTTYGPQNLLIMQGKTQGYNPAKQFTYDFARENPNLLKDYPDAFKFFAPNDGPDAHYEAYNAAFEKGQRTILSFREWNERANDRVASMIYYNLKDKLGPTPTRVQLDQLSILRQSLAEKYPGFDPESSDPKRRERTINQFYTAAATNDLNHTAAGRGITAYLSARDQAIASSLRAGIKGWGSAKKTRSIRVWLRQIAAQLSRQYPGFDRAYEQVFEREMVKD